MSKNAPSSGQGNRKKRKNRNPNPIYAPPQRQNANVEPKDGEPASKRPKFKKGGGLEPTTNPEPKSQPKRSLINQAISAVTEDVPVSKKNRKKKRKPIPEEALLSVPTAPTVTSLEAQIEARKRRFAMDTTDNAPKTPEAIPGPRRVTRSASKSDDVVVQLPPRKKKPAPALKSPQASVESKTTTSDDSKCRNDTPSRNIRSLLNTPQHPASEKVPATKMSIDSSETVSNPPPKSKAKKRNMKKKARLSNSEVSSPVKDPVLPHSVVPVKSNEEKAANNMQVSESSDMQETAENPTSTPTSISKSEQQDVLESTGPPSEIGDDSLSSDKEPFLPNLPSELRNSQEATFDEKLQDTLFDTDLPSPSSLAENMDSTSDGWEVSALGSTGPNTPEYPISEPAVNESVTQTVALTQVSCSDEVDSALTSAKVESASPDSVAKDEMSSASTEEDAIPIEEQTSNELRIPAVNEPISGIEYEISESAFSEAEQSSGQVESNLNSSHAVVKSPQHPTEWTSLVSENDEEVLNLEHSSTQSEATLEVEPINVDVHEPQNESHVSEEKRLHSAQETSTLVVQDFVGSLETQRQRDDYPTDEEEIPNLLHDPQPEPKVDITESVNESFSANLSSDLRETYDTLSEPSSPDASFDESISVADTMSENQSNHSMDDSPVHVPSPFTDAPTIRTPRDHISSPVKKPKEPNPSKEVHAKSSIDAVFDELNPSPGSETPQTSVVPISESSVENSSLAPELPTSQMQTIPIAKSPSTITPSIFTAKPLNNETSLDMTITSTPERPATDTPVVANVETDSFAVSDTSPNLATIGKPSREETFARATISQPLPSSATATAKPLPVTEVQFSTGILSVSHPPPALFSSPPKMKTQISSETQLSSSPWSISFGTAPGSTTQLVNCSPLSSWFLSNGQANFIRQSNAFSANLKSNKSAQSPEMSTAEKDFYSSLAKNHWRTWWRSKSDTVINSVLDPPLPNLPQQVVETVEAVNPTPANSSSNQTQHSESSFGTMMEALRREREASSKFEQQMLQVLQGKTMTGQAFEDAYRSILEQ
ncbi:hypothetical protein LEN26_017075 [Aphanomyces euteiches]|nr:hypothetical protein LEN26_017075 [Aphanomyces euteiches]KAH9114099.1 hypothetical protein AeMF1_011805 [Aphanomyces euteiches]KAH9190962.1 hypothetical protein AeNC1_007060 [Aphanomyces euteiches]